MPTFDPFRSVTLAMSRKSQLEGRLLSILQPHVARRVFSGRKVAVACALAVAVIVPISALRLIAKPSGPQQIATKTAETATTAKIAEPKQERQRAKPAGSEVDVTPHVESLENYFLAKFGKNGDKFARTPKDGEDWYERAYDLYHADRYAEAAVAFRRAADENYRRDTSLYNAACSYALMGDADRAIPTLSEAIAAGWDDVEKIADDSDFDPIRSDPRFARAIRDNAGTVVNRRLNETMSSYEELRNGHGDPDDWHDVGLDLLRLRKTGDAIYAFEKAIEVGDKSSTAMYNIACAYSLAGDVRNGMAALERAIDNGFSNEEKFKNDPDIALLRQQSGFAALQRKAKDLEMQGCCDGWHGKLVSHLLGDWDDAIDHHRKMTEKYPTSGRAWFNLGYVALQDRDFNLAIQSYRKTLDLGYRTGTSSYNMACAYALQGNRDAAFEWLARAKAAKFDLENYVDNDEDLESLHDDPRWDKFTEGLDLHEQHWKIGRFTIKKDS
jgi:tetratricopeptide (TPR) repeat protein